MTVFPSPRVLTSVMFGERLGLELSDGSRSTGRWIGYDRDEQAVVLVDIEPDGQQFAGVLPGAPTRQVPLASIAVAHSFDR